MSRPAYRAADREPTWTSRILDAMQAADDFMTLQQIRDVTTANHNQATAALHHLKTKARAVDCLEADGQLWWYSTGEDARIKRVDARVVEPPGNRKRGSKAAAPPVSDMKRGGA